MISACSRWDIRRNPSREIRTAVPLHHGIGRPQVRPRTRLQIGKQRNVISEGWTKAHVTIKKPLSSQQNIEDWGLSRRKYSFASALERKGKNTTKRKANARCSIHLSSFISEFRVIITLRRKILQLEREKITEIKSKHNLRNSKQVLRIMTLIGSQGKL